MRGHLKQRTRGSWTIWIEAGRDPKTGKRKQKTLTVRGTRKDAEAEMARQISQIESGTDLDPTRLTIEAFFERWLATVQSKGRSPRTLERYAELIRLHVLPTLGNIPLSKLRPLHLEKLYADRLKAGLSRQTVLHLHRVIFSALRQGVRWQLLSRNVAEAVEPPRPDKRETLAMKPEQATQLIEAAAGGPLEMPIILALGTGLRRGEILGLRWKDVDLQARRLRVVQTVQLAGGRLVFLPPKTHRSRRTVSLPEFVVEALRAHRSAQNERRLLVGTSWQLTDLILDRGDGGPLRPDTLTKQFRKLATAAGFDLHFHSLRHAHASLMLAAGVHLKVVSDRLGHSSIGITADLYSHVSPEVEERSAEALGAVLSRVR